MIHFSFYLQIDCFYILLSYLFNLKLDNFFILKSLQKGLCFLFTYESYLHFLLHTISIGLFPVSLTFLFFPLSPCPYSSPWALPLFSGLKLIYSRYVCKRLWKSILTDSIYILTARVLMRRTWNIVASQVLHPSRPLRCKVVHILNKIIYIVHLYQYFQLWLKTFWRG